MNALYPFSAVVGQEPLKLALLLCAIDPALGGVLVRGPRGVAKTTLARALAAFVPGPFVELPLGATEERLTGSIELGSALRNGRVALAEGLLARAHEGVLYVDEVNLLPDGLVDLLLDAAASGVNVVERDGISQRHAARFVLVGTMNPEEGELRPQLTDRFGLAVNAVSQILPAERAEIIALRLEHDRDPAGFAQGYAALERALAERCARARTLIGAIALDKAALSEVSQRCYAAGVEGVRADLAMLRAARAHAAWHGRSAITSSDIEAVAELALQHRRVDSPSGSSGGGPSGSSAAGSHPPDASRGPSGLSGLAGSSTHSPDSTSSELSRGAESSAAPEASSSDASSAETRPEGDWGARQAVAAPIVAASRQLLARLPKVAASSWSRARSPAARGARWQPSPRIDWFRTLLATRGTGDRKPRFRSARGGALWIIAVDCSASMQRKAALSHAKGVARELGLRARRRRAALHLITFGGRSVRTLRIRNAGLERAIIALGAGGGTPLRNALIHALRIRARQRAAREQRLFLLTDGRTHTKLDDLARVGEALDSLVIDCERTRPRLAGARRIAASLHANYLHID
jgi:magnesium chelatase subunit D